LANSPEAKGRVERMTGTLQDRLVKELRLVTQSSFLFVLACLSSIGFARQEAS